MSMIDCFLVYFTYLIQINDKTCTQNKINKKPTYDYMNIYIYMDTVCVRDMIETAGLKWLRVVGSLFLGRHLLFFIFFNY
jgi:hypothetical protein